MNNNSINANEYYGELIDKLYDKYIEDVKSRILPGDDLNTKVIVAEVTKSFWLPLFDSVCSLAYFYQVVVYNPLRGITNEEMYKYNII